METPTNILQQIQAAYQAETAGAKQKVNFIVYGDVGTGKSVLTRTMPRPVLVHSFDPGGMKSRLLEPLIKSGDILVERFEDEDPAAPTMFKKHADRFRELAKAKVFDSIGTFVVDPITGMADYIMNQILKEGGRAGTTPQIQDYMVQQRMIQNALRIYASLPCYFVATGHIERGKDEITGAILAELMIPGKAALKTPALFDEIYVSQVTQTAKGPEHTLLTQNDGLYKARTRIGAGIFERKEVSDISALLKKAGYQTERKV